MHRVGKRGWAIIVVVLAAAAVGGAWVHLRYHFVPRAFRVVEAGHLYRGGLQEPGPLRRIIRRYGIRTIVCLTHAQYAEQKIAEEMGVTWLCVPMADPAHIDGYAPVEQAAAILADPSCQPVFFHCEQGRNRSNLVQAMYRIKYCGWTVDDALDELRTTGYNPEVDAGDRDRRDFLKRYEAGLAHSGSRIIER
jgi:protein tyrosine phosphatase (PTP) superfamily phosphohydrolase (DUF442 family)